MQPYDIEKRLAISGKDLKPEIRKALEKLRSLQNEVFSAQTEISAIQNQRESIFEDQERLRENLKTVATNNDLGKRYLKELNDQEDSLAKLKKEEAAAQQRLVQAQRNVAEYVGGLEL